MRTDSTHKRVKVSGNAWELDLLPREKLVLLALTHYLNQSGKDSLPDETILLGLTGLSKRTLRRYLRSLEEKGFIKYEEVR